MVESVGKENVNVRPEKKMVLSTVESLALFRFSCMRSFYTVTLLMHLDHTFLLLLLLLLVVF